MIRGEVLGVYRERIFSPGKVAADAAVLDAALAELAAAGWAVAARPAETLDGTGPRPAVVLTMAQSVRALGVLEGWSRQGARVINSVAAVRNCYRRPLVELLRRSGVEMPPGRMVSLSEARELYGRDPRGRYWLKRGDVHAVQAGDVACAASAAELEEALDNFHRRGMEDILLQQHVEGPVVKFYGVARARYFRAYLSATGVEVSSRLPELAATAARAAAALGLEVFGGDAVLREAGGAALIDLNDWPSFSPCCRSAARSIAGYVAAEIRPGRPHAADRAHERKPNRL